MKSMNHQDSQFLILKITETTICDDQTHYINHNFSYLIHHSSMNPLSQNLSTKTAFTFQALIVAIRKLRHNQLQHLPHSGTMRGLGKQT